MTSVFKQNHFVHCNAVLFVQYFTLHKDLFIVCSLLLYNSSDACHYNAGHAKCSDHGDMLVITMFTSFTIVYTFDLIRSTTVTGVTGVTEFIQLKKQLWWPHGSTRANGDPRVARVRFTIPKIEAD